MSVEARFVSPVNEIIETSRNKENNQLKLMTEGRHLFEPFIWFNWNMIKNIKTCKTGMKIICNYEKSLTCH